VRTSTLAGLAALAATTGLLLVATSSSSSSALKCPPGTVPYTLYVNGVPVGACKPAPYPPCDPGPCDPTAIAPQN